MGILFFKGQNEKRKTEQTAVAKRHETHLQKLLLHDDQDRSVKSLSDEKKINEDHYNDGNHPISGTPVQ